MTDELNMETDEYMVVDALAVDLLRNGELDEEVQLVSWKLLQSDGDHTVIKIDFGDGAPFIASLTDEVSLRVTFWGVDHFKSTAENAVRFGTELHWRVYRQIREEEQSFVDNFDIILIVKLTLLVCLLPICLLGNSLPTWMFLNSLQLIATLPLLNTLIPENLHQFLSKYLDLTRL